MEMWKKVIGILSITCIVLIIAVVVLIGYCVRESRNSNDTARQAERMAELIDDIGPALRSFGDYYLRAEDSLRELEANRAEAGRVISDATAAIGELSIAYRDAIGRLEYVEGELSGITGEVSGVADDIGRIIDGATEESSTD